MNAAMPPWRWASAMMWRQTVVLPEPPGPAPPRDPAHAERDVERERARGYHADPGTHRVLAELHHRALAELLLDLGERDLQHLVPVHPRSLLSPRPPSHRPRELLPDVRANATARHRHG